ncbi:site-specific integrase [Cyanobium sp. CH-040]|nr:site-specific integrase [Cyanobium sp. CH-040]
MDAALADHNARLAAIGIALRIERRGARLGLRGPLPCRRGGPRRSVQRLSLGLPATATGLEQAREQLREVLRQLEQNHFSWDRWSRSPATPVPAAGADTGSSPDGCPDGGAAPAALDPAALVEQFERAFFQDHQRRRNPAGSRTTWTAAYRPYLRRLLQLGEPQHPLPVAALSQLLERVLESYEPASSSRQQCGIALAALARQGGIPLPPDWGERAAGYGLHVARFRRLPSDSQILQLLELIPSRAWRLVYGLMATYGLRNHEVFFCDLSALAPGGDRVIRVLPATKTGEHQVWPFLPEWVEHFGLEALGGMPDLLPPVCTDLGRTTLQQVGRRVAEQFRRYGLPITPYDLRHAWAVRTIHIGLPDTVAARMMGHSVAIHTRTYHHWITRRDQQQAVDAALARQRPTGQRVA